MNTLKVDTIKLDEFTIDSLGIWSKSLSQSPIPASPPIKEGIVEFTLVDYGSRTLIQIHFKEQKNNYLLELYTNEKLFTKWQVNKMVVSNSTFGIEKLPNTVNDLNLMTTMTSIWAHSIKFIDMYWEEQELVRMTEIRTKRVKKGNKQPSFYTKKVYTLFIPSNIQIQEEDGPNNIITPDEIYKQGITTESIALDGTQNLNEQINTHLDGYYSQWLNDSIPALNGKTPIEASKTEEGRKELEFLFTYIKNMPSTVPFPEDKIRKKLGM